MPLLFIGSVVGGGVTKESKIWALPSRCYRGGDRQAQKSLSQCGASKDEDMESLLLTLVSSCSRSPHFGKAVGLAGSAGPRGADEKAAGCVCERTESHPLRFRKQDEGGLLVSDVTSV